MVATLANDADPEVRERGDALSDQILAPGPPLITDVPAHIKFSPPQPPRHGPGTTGSPVVQVARLDDDPILRPKLNEGLGLRPFPDGQTGLRILFLSDPDRPQAHEEIVVRLARLDEPLGEPLSAEGAAARGVIGFTWLAIPGPYRLHVERRDVATDFALTLLPKRRCELQFDDRSGGDPAILQFAPDATRKPLRGAESGTGPLLAIWVSRKLA